MALSDAWLTIGGARQPLAAPILGPDGAPAARAYAELIGSFGPGTFNGFVHVLPPSAITTVATRLRMTDPPLARHAVFADSDNGDMLTWDLDAGEASGIFRFAPRSVSPMPIASTCEELLTLFATKNLCFIRGPIVPYFTPALPHELRHLRFAGARPTPSALAEWLEQTCQATSGVLLERDGSNDGPGWTSATLLVGGTIIKMQHTGVPSSGWWTLAFDSPKGAELAPLERWLALGASLGWTPAQTELSKALVRPRGPKG